MPSLKLISATDTQYATGILKAMNEQRSRGLFCDVTIIIQDKKFRAHKTILSASSTYFHQLFTVAGQVIELNFIRPDVFEHILNYIYSSTIVRVRSDILDEVISAGQILGVKFLANLRSQLSQVKGLPGLSKETENKSNASEEVMPIISESFSISAEEFNQTTKSSEKDEESDNDVVFVSCSDAQTRGARLKSNANQIIDLETVESETVESNHVAVAPPKKTVKPGNTITLSPSAPVSSPSQCSDSSSTIPSSSAVVCSGNAASTPTGSGQSNHEPLSTTQSSEKNTDTFAVHKKQVAISGDQGDVKLRLTDVSENSSPKTNSYKQIVEANNITPDAASEMDSSDCKVYTNIGEKTYNVHDKEDPGEGGSDFIKGKEMLMETPVKPFVKTPLSLKTGPKNKKSKMELEDHYELSMDGKTFYVCVVCRRPYVCITSLRRHFNTHSWEKKYPCHYCDKVFALAEYRTKHEVTHTGERRYQCLLCHEMFQNYQLLTSHLRQVHNQDTIGKKSKDNSENNLYRLLPLKPGQKRMYSWVTDASEAPIMSEDGGLEPINSPEDEMESSIRSGELSWDSLFTHRVSDRPSDTFTQAESTLNSSPQGAAGFDYITPETY